MEIKTKTDNLLAATARPRYIFFGIYVLLFLGLTILLIIDGPYLYAFFFLPLTIGALAGIRGGYRLTIDKQAGTITFRSWDAVRPWPKEKVTAISEVFYIDAGYAPLASKSESTIVFHFENNKTIRFGLSRGHYLKFMQAVVHGGNKESRERYAIQDIAESIGFTDPSGSGYVWYRPQS